MFKTNLSFFSEPEKFPCLNASLTAEPVDPQKYDIKISKTECLIILEPDDSNKRKLFYFKLPIKYVLKTPIKLLKILWRHNLITQQQVLLAYESWVSEESEIWLEYSDYRNLCREKIKIPVKRRGNEHYHHHTWSRIQWYQLIFDALPMIYIETDLKKEITINKTITKKINWCNTLMITLTYPKKEKLSDAWNETSPDTNRFFTNLKARLKRRDLDLLFYFKALESHKSGMPHIHIVCKLKNPVACYKYYSRRHKKVCLRPFNKKLFHWNHGNYDVTGINHSNGIKYITKYVTKITNSANQDTPLNYGNRNKTLANTWISSKRLYSNTQFCLFKSKFPSLAKFMRSQPAESFHDAKAFRLRCTVNVLVDKHFDGIKFPLIPFRKKWKYKPPLKEKFGLSTRLQADIVASDWARPPLETRLNKEGFYQVIGIRCLKPNQESEFMELKAINSQRKPPPERFSKNNKTINVN
jgi:hypothetical protein